MTLLAVIADDLTGALDASAPFAARGLSTMVAPNPDAVPQCLERAPRILGISTDSRELSPDDARRAVAACLAQLPGDVTIFKKIDSRLKGNIAAELDAIPHTRSLVIPAIPAFDRWMKAGRLGGFGVGEPIEIAPRLGSHAASAIIPDIETQDDIKAALRAGGYDLPIGARGLAEALAARLAPAGGPFAPTLDAPSITFVIGSTDPITKAQIAALRQAAPALTYIAAPNGSAPEALPTRSTATLIEATAGAPTDPAVVALGLARIVSRLDLRPGETLVVSGGATAQVLLDHLGLNTLELEGEALPGLPIARAGKIKIITKSGGFGERDALVRLLNACTATQEERYRS